MKETVKFVPEPTPAFEAQVWILQLLAEAVDHPMDLPRLVHDCAKLEIGTFDVLRILGGFVAQRLPTIGSDTKKPSSEQNQAALDLVWNDFFNEDRIARFSRDVLAEFKGKREKSLDQLAKTQFNFAYLEKANRDAHAFVRGLLKTQKLEDLLVPEPAQVSVVQDLLGTMYCAGSDRTSGGIRWAQQMVPHALSAMVLADRVLVHEYLSHLVPRNSSLGRIVQEQWLVALLQEAFLQKSVKPTWRNYLWPVFRDDFEEHVHAVEKAKNSALKKMRSFGYAGVETIASALYLNAPEAFWKFTSEVLRDDEDEDDQQATKIRDVILHLTYVGPDESRKILSRKYNKINDLRESIQA
jgi:hypothetical protein